MSTAQRRANGSSPDRFGRAVGEGDVAECEGAASLGGDAAAARRYDAWFDRGWGAYAAEVEEAALVEAAAPLDGRRVLDVGCGTGRFTAALEAAGASAVGVDTDPAMLAVAGERVAGPLVHADAHRLPFSDEAFDAVVTVTATEFLADPSAAVREAVRVTRPGGRLVVAALNPRSPWGLARRRRLRRPPWDQACLRRPDELDALLADLGEVRRHGALHAPGPVPGLRIVGPALERLGRLAPGLGAFQVRVVRRAEAAVTEETRR